MADDGSGSARHRPTGHGALGVDRVVGDAVVHDGAVAVPVAVVRSAVVEWSLGLLGLHGSGRAAAEQVRPLGSFSLEPGGVVRFRPAVDVQRVLLVAPLVAAVAAGAVVGIAAAAAVRRRRQEPDANEPLAVVR